MVLEFQTEFRFCRWHVVLIAPDHGENEMIAGSVRANSNRLLHERRRFVGSALTPQAQSQVNILIGIRGVDANRTAQKGLRLLKPPSL